MEIYRVQKNQNNHIIARNEENGEIIEFDDKIPFMAGDEIVKTEYGYGLINRSRALLASQIVISLRNKERNEEEETMYQEAVESIKRDYEENVVMSLEEMINFTSYRKAINEIMME